MVLLLNFIALYNSVHPVYKGRVNNKTPESRGIKKKTNILYNRKKIGNILILWQYHTALESRSHCFTVHLLLWDEHWKEAQTLTAQQPLD